MYLSRFLNGKENQTLPRLSSRDLLHIKRLKVKGWKKIFYANKNEKKLGPEMFPTQGSSKAAQSWLAMVR